MEYEKFFPESDDEKSLVECYYHWQGDAGTHLELQSPPTGFGALVVISSAPYLAWQDAGCKAIVPDSFVCGLFTSNYHLALTGPVNVTGVVLKPSALHNLFGLRMSALVNNRMPLNALSDNEAAQLPNAVNRTDIASEKVSALRSFILQRACEARHRFTMVEDIISYIDGNHGSVTVDEVANKFGVSRRYVETRFLEKVGVSPKFYARIRRFSRLSNFIMRTNDFDWQDIVDLGGFHDQSHLIKEFLKFNRMSPEEYVGAHKELIRIIRTPAMRKFTIAEKVE